MRRGAGLFACALLAATPAWADDVSADLACRFQHPVTEVDTLKKLPPPVFQFVHAKTGDMAKRGAYFNATDVILRDAPGHRFIRAGHSGDQWFVWFEHGGIAYSKDIAVFALGAGQKQPRLVAHILYFNENPCALTDAVLAGHPPPIQPRSEWW